MVKAFRRIKFVSEHLGICWTSMLVCMFLVFQSSAALAVMLAPTDKFVEIEKNESDKISSALVSLFEIDFSRVRKLVLDGIYSNGKSYRVTIFRFENLCRINSCVSAIFIDEIKKENFRGLIHLPSMVAKADMFATVCDSCSMRSDVYYFGSEGDLKRQIILTEFGPIF